MLQPLTEEAAETFNPSKLSSGNCAICSPPAVLLSVAVRRDIDPVSSIMKMSDETSPLGNEANICSSRAISLVTGFWTSDQYCSVLVSLLAG